MATSASRLPAPPSFAGLLALVLMSAFALAVFTEPIVVVLAVLTSMLVGAPGSSVADREHAGIVAAVIAIPRRAVSVVAAAGAGCGYVLRGHELSPKRSVAR